MRDRMTPLQARRLTGHTDCDTGTAPSLTAHQRSLGILPMARRGYPPCGQPQSWRHRFPELRETAPVEEIGEFDLYPLGSNQPIRLKLKARRPVKPGTPLDAEQSEHIIAQNARIIALLEIMSADLRALRAMGARAGTRSE